MRRMLVGVVGLCAAFAGVAQADLASEFASFDTVVSQIGTSGYRSNYFQNVKDGNHINGSVTGSNVATFGPDLVSYPNGVGMVPSPGLSSGGRYFDQGKLGIDFDGTNLTVKVASGMDPRVGKLFNGTWYNSGDMFVAVKDASGVRHYALTNRWARTGGGGFRTLDGGHFNDAQSFHTGKEGKLIQITNNNQITKTGGAGAYTNSNAPQGLDMRAFVDGGTDRGSAGLSSVTSLHEFGQDWYLYSWTLPISLLTGSGDFSLSFHQTMSCGNDQIGGGMTHVVPTPGAALLGCIGLSFAGWMRRRLA